MTSSLFAALLGCLQGATEFLPISSSGHLVLAQHLLHVRHEALLFDVWLHFGTLLAIFVVLRRPVGRLVRGMWRGIVEGIPHPFLFMKRPEGADTYLVWLVILASIPTAIIGFSFKDLFEKLFEGNIRLVGIAFLFTAFLLFLTKFRKGGDGSGGKGIGITPLQALLIGAIQGIAIIPGVSRSGSTISLALLLGIARRDAGEFSFLIVIPAIGGAMILQTLQGIGALSDVQFLASALIGMATAFGVGVFALKFLLRLVNQGSFYRFSFYCFGMGVICLWIGR